MCGIGGIYKLRGSKVTDAYIEDLAEKLLHELQVRGEDATGVAAINTITRVTKIHKAPLKAEDFTKTEAYKELANEFHKANLVLLHTRAATRGNPKNNNNNHPFESPLSKAVLIHNGVLWNAYSLEHSEQLVRPNKSEVDSELILLLYDKYHDVNQIIPRVDGDMAMALYTKRRLYLYSSGRPLAMAYLVNKKIIVFASTKEILRRAIDKPTYYFHLDFFLEKEHHFPRHVLYTLTDGELVSLDWTNERIRLRILKMKKYRGVEQQTFPLRQANLDFTGGDQECQR